MSKKEAKMLIKAIENEIEDGTIHRNKSGRELKTVYEVVKTLQKEGNVEFEPKRRIAI